MTTSGSQGVRQPVPGSADSYAVSLRVRHPEMDPAIVTSALRLEPEHSWKAGDPRQARGGGAGGGQYRESYWSARLTQGISSSPLELFLGQQLLQLSRHKDFFSRLQSEGGEICIVVELAPIANAVLTLSSLLARRLADLNLQMEFQFVES